MTNDEAQRIIDTNKVLPTDTSADKFAKALKHDATLHSGTDVTDGKRAMTNKLIDKLMNEAAALETLGR